MTDLLPFPQGDKRNLVPCSEAKRKTDKTQPDIDVKRTPLVGGI